MMDRPIVTVKQGKLQGIFEENVFDGSQYLSFKGIPFAAPPIGELRFKDPEPPDAWEGIRDASKNAGDVCAQLDRPTITSTPIVIGSEDCLYLNIYIPKNICQWTGNPVMVWIHGGGYVVGSGNDTHTRPDYLMTLGRVILVSINYRLGAFGFLNLGHEEASGNQGLKDQVAALKWIQKNINVFGGDPNNITVFGVNAGSSSAHLLTLSPLSKDLFHKAILQSGVITCDWAMIRNQPETNSFKLASLLGNDSKDPKEVIDFLRKIPTAEIVEKQHQVLTAQEMRIINIPFGPTIDDKAKSPLVPYPISQLLNDDNNIPIMVGYTSHEYIYFLEDTSKEALETMYAELPLYVEKFLNSKDSEKITKLTELIKERYFDNKPFDESSIPSIIQWLSDFHFKIPIQDLVNRRRKKQALTYLYQFSYVGSQMTETRLMGNKLTTLGASHTDDLSYLFYLPKSKINDPNPQKIDGMDRYILGYLTRKWIEFAISGKPAATYTQITIWRPATADTFNYLDISDTIKQKIIDNSFFARIGVKRIVLFMDLRRYGWSLKCSYRQGGCEICGKGKTPYLLRSIVLLSSQHFSFFLQVHVRYR